MVDNFKQIIDLLVFDSDDDFYFLQLIMRKKENPELGSNNRVIRSYFIKSKEQLLQHEKEIKAICAATNSRACINLNRRSFEKCALQTLKNVTDHLINRDYEHIHRAYTTVCGKFKNEPRSTFIVDIDGPMSKTYIHEMIQYINQQCEPLFQESKIVAKIPTKNGIHLITTGFNISKFYEKYPEVDVHKNNPTILYIP